MLNRSLHVKLFCTSLFGAAAVLALLLGSISYIAFEFALKKNAALVDSIVRENAKEVEVQLGVGWTVAESVARLAVSMKEQQLSRDVVNAVTKNLLEANAQLAGLGHYWEANAFDGKDSDFVNQPSHDSTGRYLVYWSRSGGGVKPEVLTGYSTENPSNQYYYKPLRSHISWASEPFSYNDASGRPQMMVSLMVPLLVKGRALGVGGVDIPLETISRQLKKIEIFKGYGALVSSEGLYASHPDPDRWGKSATELPAAALEAIQSGRPYSFVRNGWKYTLESVRIGKAPNNWALMVAYPQAEALAEINHFVLVSVLIGAVGLLLLACALWFLLGWQIRPLSELTKGIEAWQGELTLEFEQRGSDETGKLAAAFNAFIKRLNGLVYSIRQSSTTLAQISDHLGDTTHAVADRAASQHTATEEMANGVTALAHSVTELSQQAEDVEHLARETEALTTQISTEMTQTLEGITHIDSTMDLVSGAVSDLEGRSQQIAGIIAVIRSIAEQTNLLALNAAIEAARAGEQGRGFAVVADEVRQLAERTSKSTGEIGEMIGAIGSDVRNTVNNVQLVSVAVSHSVAQLTDSAEGVQQIRQHARDILGRISEVARQTQSQAATGEELSVAIQGVSRIAGENDHAIRDLLDQSSKLRNQAGSLNNQLTQFKN